MERLEYLRHRSVCLPGILAPRKLLLTKKIKFNNHKGH